MTIPSSNPNGAAPDVAAKKSYLRLGRLGQRVAVVRGWLWWRLRAYVIPGLVASALGALCIWQILARAGEPALPLDDAFIHLQYARRLAQGHWFSYTGAAGYSAGATSLLWPLALAPFFVVGLTGVQVIWVLWVFGVLLHAAVILETSRVAASLTNRVGAIGAGAMAAFFGAFAWFSYSGMEGMALAWLLIRTVRVATDCCGSAGGGSCRPKGAGRRRPRGSLAELLILGVLAPLVRPEGAVPSLIAAIAAGYCVSRTGRRGGRRLARVAAAAFVPLCGPWIIPLQNWLLTGHSTSNTAMVKWLVLDPYLDLSALVSMVWGNVRFLATSLLNGGAWTLVFIPKGFIIALLVGVIALAWIFFFRATGPRRSLRWPVLFVVLAVAGTLIPCSYGSFLWNRVRYIWPFAPAWFVVITCGCWAIGALVSRIRPVLVVVQPALLGAAVALLGIRLPWAVFDLSLSARAIALQQVKLGRWARGLPANAVIGVNDTGAIAYLSDHQTFDVVGLTTEGEAPYWVAGAGSRFEHYERLGPARLPTHFIVYPHWMACPAVLGQQLHHETVPYQTILGGPTMIAYQARYDLLHSGARPFTTGRWGKLLAELDVADLQSERASDFQLGQTRANDNVAALYPTDDGRMVADGGRVGRRRDEFWIELPTDTPATMVMRVIGPGPLEIWVDAKPLATVALSERRSLHAPPPADNAAPPPKWVERAIVFPAGASRRRQVKVEAAGESKFGAFHYWWFQPLGH